jgi:FAD/FMN-containing dehydrogenase
MGNTTSIAAVRDCLTSAVGGNVAYVAFQDQLLFQAIAVEPYNLNIPVTPAAVTYPQSADEIASVLKCASEFGYKVQARSGGHSFGNYGMALMMVAVLPGIQSTDSYLL